MCAIMNVAHFRVSGALQMTTLKYSVISLILAVVLASHPTFNGLVQKGNAYLLGFSYSSQTFVDENFQPDDNSCKPQHKTNVVASNLSWGSGFYPVDSYAKN